MPHWDIRNDILRSRFEVIYRIRSIHGIERIDGSLQPPTVEVMLWLIERFTISGGLIFGEESKTRDDR